MRHLQRIEESGHGKDNLLPRSVSMTEIKKPAADEHQEETKEATNEVESTPAFNEVRLTDEEQDSILI